jgi:D-proline reductase (dithiol) PrdB
MPESARKQFSRLIGKLYTRIPLLARRWAHNFDALNYVDVPFVPFTQPISAARLALISTGGVHLRNQPPFNMQDTQGDPSYRVIPADTGLDQLIITHDYYDHGDAEKDLNILFPLGMLRELVAEGHIGSLATCYGFMGHIEPPHVATLINQSAPQIAGKLKQEHVDAVLLSPA